MPFCIGWVENFDEITLSRTVKDIEANLCFAIFDKNSKWPPFLGRGKFFENYQFENSKWPPFLGRGKVFENCQEYSAQIP